MTSRFFEDPLSFLSHATGLPYLPPDIRHHINTFRGGRSGPDRLTTILNEVTELPKDLLSEILQRLYLTSIKGPLQWNV